MNISNEQTSEYSVSMYLVENKSSPTFPLDCGDMKMTQSRLVFVFQSQYFAVCPDRLYSLYFGTRFMIE